MERCGDREFHGLLQTQLARLGYRSFNSCGGTGDHDLARGIVIGDAADTGRLACLNRLGREILIRAQQRCHRTLADRNRLLHGLATQLEQFGRIGDGQGPCRCKC